MSDLDAFRERVRIWLKGNCPPEMRLPVQSDDDNCWGGRRWRFVSEAQRLWLERLAEKGWTAPEWPRQYGGGGLSRPEAKIVLEEMRILGCRPALHSFGLGIVGPVLLQYGSEEQRQEHLPKIARGEIRWTQGYSEPNAGSDLASLQCRAEDKGDHFQVSGQKIWTSFADKADWILCLVRTDPHAPKHEGISLIFFDMESAGVSTKPITMIAGSSPFCQTFFDGVCVPKKNLVGLLNGGWEITRVLLAHERNWISSLSEQSPARSLSLFAAEMLGLDERGVLANPMLRAKIAAFEIDEAAFQAAMDRVGDLAKSGQANPVSASMLKYYGAELNKRREELLMAAGGADALEWEGPRSCNGARARAWLGSKSNSIEGGTSEVQLNIIAKRVLELRGT